jgi:hypothetical protein
MLDWLHGPYWLSSTGVCDQPCQRGFPEEARLGSLDVARLAVLAEHLRRALRLRRGLALYTLFIFVFGLALYTHVILQSKHIQCMTAKYGSM